MNKGDFTGLQILCRQGTSDKPPGTWERGRGRERGKGGKRGKGGEEEVEGEGRRKNYFRLHQVLTVFYLFYFMNLNSAL